MVKIKRVHMLLSWRIYHGVETFFSPISMFSYVMYVNTQDSFQKKLRNLPQSGRALWSLWAFISGQPVVVVS